MADDILIHDAMILSLSPSQPELVKNRYLAIKNGKITKAGPMSALPLEAIRNNESTTLIDGAGSLVMPGLVNTHTHAAMTLFRGLADDLQLMTWLQEHIFPAEAKYASAEMVYWCTKLAVAEMILSGTTTVADGYFFEDSAARAFMETGIRAVASQGIIDFPAPGVPDPGKNIENAALFLKKLKGVSKTVTPGLFCHSPYTCSAGTLKNAKKLAQKEGVHFFIHVAETKGEVQQAMKMHGKSPVNYLNSLGILDEETVCVHCVWLTEEEMNILAETKTKVSTCPESNMKLASGIAPLKELIGHGITTGLGTDSCASNNNLDLFSEMDTCAKIHKVTQFDPTALPANQVLKMATIGGAAVLGQQKEIATLAPGKNADIIMINLNQPHLVPFYNPDLLVYAAKGADVTTVIINGRLVMQERKILSFDLEETMTRVKEMSKNCR